MLTSFGDAVGDARPGDGKPWLTGGTGSFRKRSRVRTRRCGKSGALEMQRRTSSLLWAVMAVSVAWGAAVWLQQDQRVVWRFFILPIWSEILAISVLQGLRGAARPVTYVVTFVVAVLIWWAFIDGGRRAWAWWRTRD